MKSMMFLSNSYFVALYFLFELVSNTESCDTRWIRLTYMMACGKKKRESGYEQNSTLSEPLPKDVTGLLQYYLERDPENPMFHDDKKILHKILHEEGRKSHETLDSQRTDKTGELLGRDEEEEKRMRESGLSKKLLPKSEHQNYFGIPGFPDQWDIEELTGDKINENHRREIDRLIEECCKIPPVTNCNGNTFLGACK